MIIKRSRNTQDFKTAFKDKLRAMEFYRATSESITTELLKLRDRFNVPGYSWQWAWGYYDAIRDGWYREKLVFCREWQGEITSAKWADMPEALREALRSNVNVPSAHYWKNDDGTFSKKF